MSKLIVKILVGAIIGLIALLVLIRMAWIALLLLPLVVIAGIVLAFVIVMGKLAEKQNGKPAA
jgi:hypothetical protein